MEKVGDNLCEKILIVQDDPSGRTATPELVSRSGYATALVKETPQAVDKVGQESPDLVILDLGMAIPERLELLAHLKSDRFTRHIPIFVVGTPTQSGNRTHWIDGGADDYIDYPYHPDILNARIHAILRRYVPHNPVTSLPIGTYLQRQVDAWLARNLPTAVVYIDIDHFEVYKRVYGREAGDSVLRHLARLIVDVLPVNSLLSVAHVDEDDFMMAFPPPGVETRVQTLVDRFQAAQKDFYSDIDFTRGYISYHDPTGALRHYPLLTLSAVHVTNHEKPLVNFLQTSFLLNKSMAEFRADREEPEEAIEPFLDQEVCIPSVPAETLCDFYTRICKEIQSSESNDFEEYAPKLGSHFVESGDHERAAMFFRIAGDRAQRRFDPTAARTQYENSLRSLARLPEGRDHLKQRIATATGYAMAASGSEPPTDILARLTAIDSVAQESATPSVSGARSDRYTLGRLHLWIGRLLNITNQPLEGIAYCQQVLDVTEDDDEKDWAAIPSGEMGLAFARQGYFGRAVPLLLMGSAYFEDRSDWQQWTFQVAHLAISLVASGQVQAGFNQAESMMRRAWELNSKSAIAVCHLFLSFVYMLGGEAEKSLASSRASVELAGELGELLILSMGYGFRAWGESMVDDYAGAIKSLRLQGETVGRLGGQMLMPDQFAAIGAEIALRQGSADKARALAEQAIDMARQMKAVFAEAFAERVLAKAMAATRPAQYEAAERHLISSVNAFELGGCHVEAARTRYVWGLIAAARGRLGTARRQLQSSAAQFEAAGLKRELNETREILNAVETQNYDQSGAL